MAIQHPTYQEAVEQGLIEGLPSYGGRFALNKSILATLRVMDEQDAVQSIDWDFLPRHILPDLIERILYYRGTGALFRFMQRFYFLPYVAKGLDCYGRPTKITPLTWNGELKEGKDAKEKAEIEKANTFVPELELTPIWDVIPEDERTLESMDNYCVIFYDYTPQQSKTLISRQALNEPVLQVMADMIPFMRTSLKNSIGVTGIKVSSNDEATEVQQANDATERAALRGDKWIPINGTIQMQELGRTSALGANEYLLALQSLDNYRLSTHGLKAGGLFQKNSHMLQAEQDANSLGASLVLQDRVAQRQRAAMIADSIWPLGIDVYASESVLGMDTSGDGMIDNRPRGEEITNINLEGGEENAEYGI